MTSENAGPPRSAEAARSSGGDRLRKPLIASLVLNLFLIGVAGGWLMSGHHRPGPPPDGGAGGEIGHWLRNLPEGRREEVKAMFDASRDSRRERRAEIHAARDAAVLALEARPYVPAALEEPLRHIREQGEALTREAHRDIAAVVGRMTDEERAAYAGQLRRPPAGPPMGAGRPPREAPEPRRPERP